MRHLFVINPCASGVKLHLDSICHEINLFFRNHPEIEHDIHITRWCRDAVGYVRKYVTSQHDKIIRIHSIGGLGTLYEIINAIMGYKNVEIACYPYGMINMFLEYFGAKNMHDFRSIEKQVFCNTVKIDAMRCGSKYGIAYASVGFEAFVDAQGAKWTEKGMPTKLSHMSSAALKLLGERKLSRTYHIKIDGRLIMGDYVSVLIMCASKHGRGPLSARASELSGGNLDIFLMREDSRKKMLPIIGYYAVKGYGKLPNSMFSYRGKTVSIVVDDTTEVSIDGEAYYENSMIYEILPKAISLACPTDRDKASKVKTKDNAGDKIKKRIYEYFGKKS